MRAKVELLSYGGARVAQIVSTPISSGAMVEEQDVLFELDNHKATQEIVSPAAGRLVHCWSPGDLVTLDRPLAYVIAPDEHPSAYEQEIEQSRHLGGWDDIVSDSVSTPAAKGDIVPVHKATEIAVLGNGAGNSMLSMVGGSIGRVVRSSSTADFFRGKILDLVAFETSRLLAGKKYRLLNSYFEDGRIVPHDTVTAGVGFDEGGRLTLYCVENADKRSLIDTQNAIVDGLMRYVGRTLQPGEISTATFTISDLSASSLTFSLPILPRQQCIIIAITRSHEGEYSLYVSFDHRVTEGLLVSNFLVELIGRLQSYHLDEKAPAEREEAACHYCMSTLSQERSQLGNKGLMKIVDRDGQDVLCCSSCWKGL